MITLYKFYSKSCLPCSVMNKSFTKVLTEIDKDVMSTIKVIEVDVEENTELATKYKIRTIPALVITNPEHDECHKMVGFYLVREIKHFIMSNYMLLKKLS